MAAPAAQRLRRMAGTRARAISLSTATRHPAAGRPGTSRATNGGEAGDPPASPRCWPPRVWRVTGEGFPSLTVMTACGGHLAVWPRVSSFRRGRGSPRRLPPPVPVSAGSRYLSWDVQRAWPVQLRPWQCSPGEDAATSCTDAPCRCRWTSEVAGRGPGCWERRSGPRHGERGTGRGPRSGRLRRRRLATQAPARNGQPRRRRPRFAATTIRSR